MLIKTTPLYVARVLGCRVAAHEHEGSAGGVGGLPRQQTSISGGPPITLGNMRSWRAVARRVLLAGLLRALVKQVHTGCSFGQDVVQNVASPNHAELHLHRIIPDPSRIDSNELRHCTDQIAGSNPRLWGLF
jgi:hypothetical protein